VSLKQAIIDQAQAEGFSLCRFTDPDSIPHVPDKLSDFIDAGYHGQMSWMADRQTWRTNPRALWPDAQTIIMLGESYAPEHDPTDILKHPEKGAISVYAQNRDYHDLVKKRLKRLARWLIAHSGGEVKVFVDTAPVSEKPLGQAAGLGWQGQTYEFGQPRFGKLVLYRLGVHDIMH
jgi:epoxyqueuosine reductase